MNEARRARALPNGARALALLSALGSVACGGGLTSSERASQAGAAPGQIDFTSPGGPAWPGFEPEASAPELSDADVEQIAMLVVAERVPQVSAQNPSKGPADAPVTLQVFSDFECPFCVRVAPTLSRIETRFRGRLRLVWRNYPLPGHERARPAARLALAAFSVGGSTQFWKAHDWLFSPQADLSDAGLRRAAPRWGIAAAQVEQALHSPEYDRQIDADVSAGDLAGVEGTPAVFINRYYLMGARHEAEYAIVVERALRESGG
jgi:protein-disulfide isomerase